MLSFPNALDTVTFPAVSALIGSYSIISYN
jgi:hypothetical protein